MASPAEPTVDQLAGASAVVGVLIHTIDSDQWRCPTPCAEWPVRRVVGHLVGMNLVFAAMLADEAMPDHFDIADEDLAHQYDASAALLVSRFRSPGVLERDFGGPMSSASGSDRLTIRMYDLLAHGWDVSRAIGQPLTLPDDVVISSLAFATAQLDGVDRSGRFLPAQPCPASSSPLDRLAAFLGRNVTWSPSRRAPD